MGRQTHYVKTADGLSLAYQVLGETGPWLLHVPGAVGSLAVEESSPLIARYYERLSRFCRVIRFDKRGTGLSDPSPGTLTIQQQVVDIDAVLDAAGADKVAIFGISHGGTLGIHYAVANPYRVSHLIVSGAIAANAWDPFQPENDRPLINAAFTEMFEEDYGKFTQLWGRLCMPDSPPDVQHMMADFIRATSTRRSTQGMFESIRRIDLRPDLQRIAAPTLVFHAEYDRLIPVAHGRYLAEHIPNAQFRLLPGRCHYPFIDDQLSPEVLAAVEEFVTGRVHHTAERKFVAVLFTDIVNSTVQQQERGDAAWRSLRERFEEGSARQVAQFGGRIVQFTGDGIMAAFPAPGDALRAAKALIDDAQTLGVAIRAGVHAGEAYEVEDQLFGTCVTVAARVSAQAGENEILTTEVVTGLVEGSGFSWTPIGEVELKGLPARRIARLAG